MTSLSKRCAKNTVFKIRCLKKQVRKYSVRSTAQPLYIQRVTAVRFIRTSLGQLTKCRR